MTLTLGELILRRKLHPWNEKSGVTPGVPDYRPGQDHAVIVGEDTCIVSWVDESGAACTVFCTFNEDEEWITHPQVIRAGSNWIELRPIPRAFALSDARLRLIGDAKKRRPSSHGKKKADAPDETAGE